MKRAPTLKNAPDLKKNMPATVDTSHTSNEPTSPAVSALRSRVSSMTGNTIILPVCGRDVTFKLVVIPAERVERATMVWAGNERDQTLLTKEALDDLIPSFLANGQQNPAFGREVNGITEVADGSRRRMTSIVTHSDYRVLVGDLDDEQMQWLSEIGNDYRPPSAYERGKRYARLLSTRFDGNVSQLAEAENISRKIITRCIKTAELPTEIIRLFVNPNELSARAGEGLAKTYASNADALFAFAKNLAARQAAGEIFETDDIIQQLHDVALKPGKVQASERKFGAGIKAKYKGDAVSFQLKGVPQELVKQIEDLLEQHQREQQAATVRVIDESITEIDTVVTAIRAAADSINYRITQNETQALIPFARTVLAGTKNDEDKQRSIAVEIESRYVI